MKPAPMLDGGVAALVVSGRVKLERLPLVNWRALGEAVAWVVGLAAWVRGVCWWLS